MQKLLVLLFALTVSLGFAQDLGGRTITVGSDTTYPPFETVNDANQIVGFDVDVVNAICAKINCKPEFKTYAWDGIVAAIGAGSFTDFDMVASGVSITPERAQTASFSEPYFFVDQAITTRVADEKLTVEDFSAADSSLLLGAQLGTTNAELGLQLVGDARLRTYDDFNSAILALLQGDVNGVIIDGVTANAFAKQYAGELVVNITGLSKGPLGFVFEPGDELTDAFNAGLEQIKADGTVDELSAKWFGTPQ